MSNALNFHNLTTQWGEGWIAYREDTPVPVEPKLPVQPVPMSEPNFSQGIETHIIEGLPVKVYNVPKTQRIRATSPFGLALFQRAGAGSPVSLAATGTRSVRADCFIYEDTIGADVSEEAIIQSIIENRCTASEVLSYLEEYTLNWYT